MARRVTFLADGAVVQEGATTDVFNNPATQVVADYLGLDVWLEGVVEAAEAGVRFVLPGRRRAGLREKREPGPAVACIHPDDVMVFLSPPQTAGTSLRNVARGHRARAPPGRPLAPGLPGLGRAPPRRRC